MRHVPIVPIFRLARPIAVPIGPRRQRFMAVASPAYLAAHGTLEHRAIWSIIAASAIASPRDARHLGVRTKRPVVCVPPRDRSSHHRSRSRWPRWSRVSLDRLQLRGILPARRGARGARPDPHRLVAELSRSLALLSKPPPHARAPAGVRRLREGGNGLKLRAGPQFRPSALHPRNWNTPHEQPGHAKFRRRTARCLWCRGPGRRAARLPCRAVGFARSSRRRRARLLRAVGCSAYSGARGWGPGWGWPRRRRRSIMEPAWIMSERHSEPPIRKRNPKTWMAA